MLRALELLGFKSFAERTRFEFPRGITVVVGPNGSGKSNVVDAIKWVLGEQSVKSLRGKEMADVIFNGSSSRRALNTAEVTLTFDNSDRLLPVDTPEVHITRRVYRSGEGEYLINRQPCRLRDIRDLFAGTGVATEAYSVIEQGKVDVMLQSSPRERRIIFEEAAGISRFKAKRLEASRRLERVDQNLLRLSDIVDEVDNRLKTVRLQASKARRYQEYADRLQQLRTQVALADWRTLTQQLDSAESESEQLRVEVRATLGHAEESESRSIEIDRQLAQIDETIRWRESEIFHNRERIVALESTMAHERTRCQELEDQISRDRRHLASLSLRAGDLEQQVQATVASLHAAESYHRIVANRLADEQRALTDATAQLDQLAVAGAQRRTAHLEAMRDASALAHEIGALETRASLAQTAEARYSARLTELETVIRNSDEELSSLEREMLMFRQDFDSSKADLAASRAQAAATNSQLSIAERELTELKSRQTAASERTALLEELEKRLEGLDAGVKEVLLKSREASTGAFRLVRGVLADLLHVNVDAAALVEAALGDRAQAIVVAEGDTWYKFIADHPAQFSGRVCFLRLDPSDSEGQPDFSDAEGVLGRAYQFVETSQELAPLVRHLLANTWIVERLQHALLLSNEFKGTSSFVTLAGEVLAADGSLTVGPPHARGGLISRRSELRALREQLLDLKRSIAVLDTEASELRVQLSADEQTIQDMVTSHQQAGDALNRHELLLASVKQRRRELEDQRVAAAEELQRAGEEYTVVCKQSELAAAELAAAKHRVAELEELIQADVHELERLQGQRDERRRQATLSTIELAKSEQQLESFVAESKRYEQDQQERLRAILDSRSQLEQTTAKSRNAEALILKIESQLAELYLKKESERSVIQTLAIDRHALQQNRTQAGADAQKGRTRLRKLEDRLHKKDLITGELRFERQSLADRVRDEYAIELSQLAHQPTPAEEVERQKADEEIADLRRKISSIGGVNLEALGELQELETRYESLSGQLRDLTSAKASLEQIIGKINADSRRLFSETLETVRGHFQVLFRNLFGGGQADLVLDEGDILESGVEIVARPPGKEPRSISLLSGGEKTLTCVALLLAIFRSRPSPFCVLDEVDAALDEANIERFVGVLREFLNWTQFIVVTHSKKTMTCAGTLYGVTMQESGVSKRVSVRFEDVSENGEIQLADSSAAEPISHEDGESQAA